eukprot:SAG31_NODE_2566_length_5466_cov_6.677846_6_plen_73_part_00
MKFKFLKMPAEQAAGSARERRARLYCKYILVYNRNQSESAASLQHCLRAVNREDDEQTVENHSDQHGRATAL